MIAYKTKAAMPGRSCHYRKTKPTQNSTLFESVKSGCNRSFFTHYLGVAGGRVSDLQLSKSLIFSRAQKWVFGTFNNLAILGQNQSPEFSGYLFPQIWGDQPFGSMPRRFNSCLANSLNQLLSVMLSDSAAAFSCSRNSGCIRIWNAGDCPPDFGVRSFTLDIVHTFSFNEFHKVCTLYHEYLPKKTPPKGITSTRRGLTTNVSESNEAAMKDHITNPQGRNNYTWRFLAVSKSYPNTQAIAVYTNAPTEAEARSQIQGCVLYFAARLPVQEVRHV